MIGTLFNQLFENVTGSEKTGAIERLVEQSSPRVQFFLFTILSVVMATLGVLLDNLIVVIASMLIAPALYPVLSFAMGLSVAGPLMIFRSLYTILKSVVLAVAASATVAYLASPYVEATRLDFVVLITQSNSFVGFAGVALIAGLAASFAIIKPDLSETLPGTAIAASLVPPLALIGLGLAHLDWPIIRDASLLFAINVVAIALASLVVFSLTEFHVKRKAAAAAVKKDEKEIEKEKEKAEE